jgi:hypothetical protein
MLLLPRNCIRGLIPIINTLKGGVLNPSARMKTPAQAVDFVFKERFYAEREKRRIREADGGACRAACFGVGWGES